jgi:hypothetical protein
MYGDGVGRSAARVALARPSHEYADSRIVMQDAYDNDNTCFVRTPDSVLSDYWREIRATDTSASP